jgi:hypothetical protein
VTTEHLARLVAYFARQSQWPSAALDRAPGVEVHHLWSVPPFRSVAHLVGGGPTLIYDSSCPAAARPEQRGAVAHFVARVNFELTVGAFAVDWATGAVRFRAAVDLRGGPLTEEAIDGVVYPSHQAMIDWLPHLMAVVAGDMAPDETFAEALEQRSAI